MHRLPLEQITAGLVRCLDRVPADVPVGMHLCYDDYGHQHFNSPRWRKGRRILGLEPSLQAAGESLHSPLATCWHALLGRRARETAMPRAARVLRSVRR
jgi:hypothetical protein